ncbi:MAG: IclR family transcriptional regulator [Solirubrobacteraceae bacterium]
MSSDATGPRGLSTARAVLQVLAHLREHPEGVRADEVAALLGKSQSTAYYLLASLCEEGFAVHDAGCYRAAAGPDLQPPPVAEPAEHPLAGAVNEVFRRTRKRSYLGVADGPEVRIAVVCGRQGVARMPGLGTRITTNAHALAMGKVVLALLTPDARRRYVERGLERFTPHTICDPDLLASELERVHTDGYAVDREEFDADFCCIAAPVFDERGRARGVLGLSVGARAFDAQRDELVGAIRAVATSAFPTKCENARGS